MKKFTVILAISLIIPFLLNSCSKRNREKTVVVYVSEDRVFSEPVLKEFEKETGIKVKAIYDTEENKSTGVMNRLIAEKNNPQADVYWANEPIRAEVLKQKGISQPYLSKNARTIPDKFKDKDGYWTGFSARARVFIVNKNSKEKPESILDYINPKWKGKCVIANPLFGTTTTEIAALFTLWGKEKTMDFLEKMKENKVLISTSNGESADLVAQGDYTFSLVDSDDAVNRIKQGKGVEIVYPDQKEGEIGTLILPNAVILIKGAPHKKEGEKLIDFLLSPETEQMLAKEDCAQIPLHKGVNPPSQLKEISKIKTMNIDYFEIAKKMIEIQPVLKKWIEN